MTTPTYPDLYAQATALVKGRVARWPSAYASGQVVREYKRLATERHGSRARPYAASAAPSAGKLARWFREKWVDISTGKPCGSVKSVAYYPVCRPESVARALTPRQRVLAIAIKQRAKTRTASYPSFFAGKNTYSSASSS